MGWERRNRGAGRGRKGMGGRREEREETPL